MIAIKEVNNINHELNDPYLNSFHSRYLAASILKFIGSMIIHAGAVILAVTFYLLLPIYDLYYLVSSLSLIISPIIVLIVGFVTMIIGSSVEIGAWDNLKLFIYHHKELFPEGNSYYTTAKVDNLRSGAVAWALGFLIITIIIGWIFQLIGYFGLSNAAERGTKMEPIAPKTQVYQTPSLPTQESQPVDAIEFCPMCGTNVVEGATYCRECGVKILN
jgi:hypothetical protein